jgi:hypothetical protein
VEEVGGRAGCIARIAGKCSDRPKPGEVSGVKAGVKLVMFCAACLGTSILLRFWIRAHPEMGHMRTGLVALGLAVVWGWWVLVRWRFRDPELACAFLGICAAVGGAGLHIVTHA